MYIINRGYSTHVPALQRGWKKVRVIRNAAGGYTLQHADIAATNYQPVDIPKNDAYYFNYVALEKGLVTIEPEKTKWDPAFIFFSVNYFPGTTTLAPHFLKNVLIQNRNVEIAEIYETGAPTGKTFETLRLENTWRLVYDNSQTAIGTKWRQQSDYAPRTAKFYVIKNENDRVFSIKISG